MASTAGSVPLEGLPEVTADAALLEIRDGVTLVDVREQAEWDTGHAPGATLLALSELQERASELPKGSRLLIVCHSGARSSRATSFLRSQGFDAVNIEGGMVAWGAAGGPIVTDSHTAHADDV